MEPNDISHEVIGHAMKIHSALGPGLLESAYEVCLVHDLTKAGFQVERQLGVPLVYDGLKMDIGYRLDLLVNDTVIVELKATEVGILPLYQAQLLSYLRLTGKKLGLVINFHSLHLKDGIKRMVNHL
jgi:GxxExxY protein